MKQRYAHHHPKKIENIKRIWEVGIFVFDANTLLNFYRYSQQTSTDLLSILSKIQDQVWLPEQAAHEYYGNRLNEIATQAKAYEDAVKVIDGLRESLRKDRGHPFVSTGTLDGLDAAINSVTKELVENKDKLKNSLLNDEILDKLSEIFNNRVGPPFNQDDLETLFLEGEKRYAARIPPGYMDARKFNDPVSSDQKRAIFGDLLIWKPLIAMARETNRPVVFVTDDGKEDWWLEVQGKTIGARPELIDEFSKEAKQEFCMYRPDQFVQFAKEHLGFKLRQETINEVQASDEDRVRSAKPTDQKLSEFLRDSERFLRAISKSNALNSDARNPPGNYRSAFDNIKRTAQLSAILRNLEVIRSSRIDQLTKLVTDDTPSAEDLDRLAHRHEIQETEANILESISSISKEIEQIKDELDSLKLSLGPLERS